MISKSSPAQDEALRRVVATARSMVSAYDEFAPDEGWQGIIGEALQHLDSAMEIWGKVRDEDDEARRLAILEEASDRSARQRSAELDAS